MSDLDDLERYVEKGKNHSFSGPKCTAVFTITDPDGEITEVTVSDIRLQDGGLPIAMADIDKDVMNHRFPIRTPHIEDLVVGVLLFGRVRDSKNPYMTVKSTREGWDPSV